MMPTRPGWRCSTWTLVSTSLQRRKRPHTTPPTPILLVIIFGDISKPYHNGISHIFGPPEAAHPSKRVFFSKHGKIHWGFQTASQQLPFATNAHDQNVRQELTLSQGSTRIDALWNLHTDHAVGVEDCKLGLQFETKLPNEIVGLASLAAILDIEALRMVKSSLCQPLENGVVRGRVILLLPMLHSTAALRRETPHLKNGQNTKPGTQSTQMSFNGSYII